MKKHYSEPEMEVVGLSREDMILTSGECFEDGVMCDEEGLCDEGCTNPGMEVADEG